MKKNQKVTTNFPLHSRSYPLVLLLQGIVVGIVAGTVVMLYRLLLTHAAKWLNSILTYTKGSPLKMAGWFAALLLMALLVGWLVKKEPMISGSGIPQISGEMAGQLNQTWWRVLPSKFLGGFLCVFSGLSVGREGPSIQLGAMAGKGISRLLKSEKTDENYLLTCGAGAGLSAAFGTPLAGVLFCLEELHKNFSSTVLVSVMASSITANMLTSAVLGRNHIFQFSIEGPLPFSYYWMLLLLGLLLGVMGAFYNWFTLKSQDLYRKPAFLNTTTRLLIPFMLAGILGYTIPEVLGGGDSLIELLTEGHLVLQTALLFFIVKFLFSAISFGSGAPGGIFFPLLVLGAFIGGIFAMACTELGLLPAAYINNFVLLAMAGYFTAIVRAPLTGIILIFEMTGTMNQLLSLTLVTITAYIMATLLGSKPIYESLLERILSRQGIQEPENPGAKILREYVVMHNSPLDGAFIKDVDWPKHALIVSIKNQGNEIIPHGNTIIPASGSIVIVTEEKHLNKVNKIMTHLCTER